MREAHGVSVRGACFRTCGCQNRRTSVVALPCLLAQMEHIVAAICSRHARRQEDTNM
jgi:hypothetical protein